jgi:hypothetical protein
MSKLLPPLTVIGLALLLAACGDAPSGCRAEVSPGSGAGGGDVMGGQTGTPLVSQPLGGSGGSSVSDATSPNAVYGPYPCY